jgi:hypothetical protein
MKNREISNKQSGIEIQSFDFKKVEEEVSIKVEELKKIPIILKAFHILDKLPVYLKYHIKKHTEDVFHEAILFAMVDKIEEEKIIEIATAAAWHDVGFLIQPNDNEKEAIRLFEEESKQLESEQVKIKNIKSMILDTKLEITEQGPKMIMKNPMSAHLLDADVSNFGREDFREKLNLVAEEKNVDLNNKKEKLQFLRFTLSLLKNQNWNTHAAETLRQMQKIINTRNLEEEIMILEN